MRLNILLVSSLVLLSGCALIAGDTRQPVRVETLTANGQAITGAQCELRNDRERIAARSGETVSVRRSARPLDIVCRHDAQPEARARLLSRSSALMKSNVFFLFGLGAVVDHRSGAGYAYPGWVRLFFGETLTFDRKDENPDAPVPARPPSGESR